MPKYFLEMRQIRKAFKGTTALRGIDFSVRKSAILGLIGENGAGKSTLMNILGGVLQPDHGEILVEDTVVSLPNPAASQTLGIGFVHQDLNLVSDLKIFENLYLGKELTKPSGFLDADKMRRRTTEILAKLGVSLNPDSFVRDIEPSFQQIVEIAKAFLHNAKLIIMDEPSSALAEHEVNKLFQLMRSLKTAGVSIIFISHKLKEILQICDQYTVLRDGLVAGAGAVKDTNEEQLAKLMVGRDIAALGYYVPRKLGEPLILMANGSCGRFFKDINFTLHAGEILGFTGLAGDGRTELFESLFGYRKNFRGEILIGNRRKLINHPHEAQRLGIGLAPKNRKENAIIGDMSVRHNLTLAALKLFQKFFFLSAKREKETTRTYIQRLQIKVSDARVPITSLSGGNQQKVILGRWLAADAKILILDNPTQGIDVGTKSEIYQLIMKLADEGKGIVILSSEIPEILKLCDRVFVMYHGEITGAFSRAEATEEKIMMYATGVDKTK
jgi:ribose transport system ATP-binding protein